MIRAAEAVATAILGAALAALAWSVVDLHWPAVVVGALNGAVAGWRRIYPWRSPRGLLAFVLDSTWALVTTAAALVAHAVALAQRDRGIYVAELSERRGRHVYARGLQPRRGFLVTIGNVVNGAGGSARRRHIVDTHENIHIWQARWFGPLYPMLYGLWTLIGAIVGLALWTLGRRRKRLWRVVDTTAYYSNPFEWWAYSRDGRWPPPGAIASLTWRRSVTRPHPSVSCRQTRQETLAQHETLG